MRVQARALIGPMMDPAIQALRLYYHGGGKGSVPSDPTLSQTLTLVLDVRYMQPKATKMIIHMDIQGHSTLGLGCNSRLRVRALRDGDIVTKLITKLI